MTDREQFDLWCGYNGQTPTASKLHVWQAATAAALERAAVACEVIENDRWALYKGRPPYTGAEPGRADNYVQGESGGAGLCAEAIRALKEQP
jgi:hypothetical protein